MASAYTLEFEKPLLELERQIEDLKRIGSERQIDIEGELEGLQAKLESLRAEIYRNLTPIQRVMVARHPRRPYTLDYLSTIFTDFIEMHGDRLYMDDPAIVGGWARLAGISVMVVGHQKGRDTKENLKRNFGMPHPEGYRKALRLMKLAAKFNAPVITLIDTPGAYPGLGAEERGQSEALARNILEMSMLPTPAVAVVIGEGGSGGALALGVADRIIMLENSVYSVISPEGCAAILWKDSSQRERAAEALKITAEDLLRLKVIDEIVKEPVGGAHIDPDSHRGGTSRGTDSPRDGAAQAPPRKARPAACREVRRDGRLLRGLMRADRRGAIQGHSQGLLPLGRRASPLRVGDVVVVEVERGRDVGRVNAVGDVAERKCSSACAGCAVGEEPAEAASPKPVARRATPDDVRTHEESRVLEEEARRKVIQRVRTHDLAMKVSDTEWQWDRNKLTIYFTAEKRVDFRALVRDLASLFRTRIELRQIGVRDEAARLSGVGRCGREYCCSGEGEVPLPKLVRYIQKLGRKVKPAELTDVLNRIKALDANRSNIPLPKGPVPTSMKGMRGNMRGR